MELRVEKVLRDINDKQVGANLYVDGVRQPRVSLSEIRSMLSSGATASNFVLTSNGLRGKGTSLEFAYFLTRDELEIKYPDRWVVIQDGTYVDGSVLGTMIDGVVVAVYTSEEYKTPECRWKYAKPGYSCERTFSGEITSGVIQCH